EGALGRRAAGPQAGAAVRAGGQGRGAAAPHQHRAGLRRGGSGWSPLLRDAVHRRAGPGRGGGRPAAAATRGVRGERGRGAPGGAGSRAGGLTAADVAGSLTAGRSNAEAPAADGSVTEPFDADATPAPANRPPADTSSAVLPGTSALSSSAPDRQYYRSVARI